jgi:carbon storage regulator
MLVLTRKMGQEIRMPEQEIIVKVLEVRGNRVRLGVTAPEWVRIHRSESASDELSAVRRTHDLSKVQPASTEFSRLPENK